MASMSVASLFLWANEGPYSFHSVSSHSLGGHWHCSCSTGLSHQSSVDTQVETPASLATRGIPEVSSLSMSLVVLATERERVVRQIKGRALVTTYGFAGTI